VTCMSTDVLSKTWANCHSHGTGCEVDTSMSGCGKKIQENEVTGAMFFFYMAVFAPYSYISCMHNHFIKSLSFLH
jgi:hypothetical protein